MNSQPRIALIIGAGPAGLTAAYELLTRGENIRPIIFEKCDYLGGISRTHNYKGNRIDIGGHRFFSKSDRVMDWWMRFMPPQAAASGQPDIHYQKASRPLPVAACGGMKRIHQSITRSDLEKKRWPPMSMRLPL